MTDPTQRMREILEAYRKGAHSGAEQFYLDQAIAELSKLMDEEVTLTVLRGKQDMISWCLSRTSMDELKQRWHELGQEEAALQQPNKSQEPGE